jgi:pimeloyl-ACP methyl ester carboxylesterase
MRVPAMVLVLGVLLIQSALVQSAFAQTRRENFKNAEVTYDWVTDNHGDRLRTFITRPKNATGKVPVVFFVGWLSCDSVEYPSGETDGFGAIFWRVIEQSGYATVRMDKPGVGESQGECGKTDFQTELTGYKAAFKSIGKYDFMDRDRLFVIGLSNGGGTSVLVPSEYPVRAYIAASSWGRTWYEHMLELERVRLTGTGKSAGEIDRDMKAFAQFYDLYLNQKMTPGEIVDHHPEWKSLWYDERDGQYGRPAAFYQQLQALNLGEADAEDCRVLQTNGWRLRHAVEVAGTPEDYQRYVQSSRGEFSCAKASCMKFQNAWVSDRSLCYLASGRPVVVQHTGPSSILPNRLGMLRFSTVAEAADCLNEAAANYSLHSRAARELTEAFFNARQVAEQILNHSGLLDSVE